MADRSRRASDDAAPAFESKATRPARGFAGAAALDWDHTVYLRQATASDRPARPLHDRAEDGRGEAAPRGAGEASAEACDSPAEGESTGNSDAAPQTEATAATGDSESPQQKAEARAGDPGEAASRDGSGSSTAAERAATRIPLHRAAPSRGFHGPASALKFDASAYLKKESARSSSVIAITWCARRGGSCCYIYI